jgi:hypothetical protein
MEQVVGLEQVVQFDITAKHFGIQVVLSEDKLKSDEHDEQVVAD